MFLQFLLIFFAALNGAQSTSCSLDCTCIKGYQRAKYSNKDVAEAFTKAGIVRDYLPVPPKELLVATFVTADVYLGQFIPPLRAIDPDIFFYPNAKQDKNYTAILFDIDVPNQKGFVNQLVVNIPRFENLASGQIIVPFTPPVPSVDSGEHRGMVLLYEQERYIDPEQMDLYRLSRRRTIPDIEMFTDKYGLGDPVAGNFIRTELTYRRI